ncbi:arginine--tRNA ligase [Candidatus Kaiserbacteria bacterium]|nr:arginine--tRNA ligase [Candidatus Kaiserbacteria bacterium]
MIRETITHSIQEALNAVGITAENIVLEHPVDLSHGDFSCNVAMMLAKKEGRNSKELAEEIVKNLKETSEIQKVEVAGPGFINFFLSQEFFTGQIENILEEESKWGSNELLNGKKIMVEYTQPNPFKPFHIGHLMSNTIGESISRLVEFSGAETRRANYQGDIGLHVAKALWGIGKEGFDARSVGDLGIAYAYGHEKYEEDENAKLEIIELNKRIVAKDSDLMDTYTIGLNTSLNHFEEIYKVLDTKFDYYFFEGQSLPIGLEMVEKGLESGIFRESEGAVVFPGEEYGFHTRVFKTQYGTTTYETRDLGLPLLKQKEFNFDTSITITAVEQKTYFDVVFKAFSLLNPDFKGKLIHIPHGMMQLASGKMSSRKGNVITGESLINEMKTGALKKMKSSEVENKDEAAEQVGVAAIKYSVLKQSTGKNISFDEEQSLSFEGDSGPYLQYTNARILSILDKAKTEGIKEEVRKLSGVTEIEKLLPRFPEVVERAAREYEPHYVTTYLTDVASAFNSWYGQTKILDGTDEAPYKLACAHAVSITLKNGLWLLGIKAPERM